MSILARGPFGGVTLTGVDAKRLLRHMTEDEPSPAAIDTLQRGRELLAVMKRTGSSAHSPVKKDPTNTEDATV